MQAADAKPIFHSRLTGAPYLNGARIVRYVLDEAISRPERLSVDVVLPNLVSLAHLTLGDRLSFVVEGPDHTRTFVGLLTAVESTVTSNVSGAICLIIESPMVLLAHAQGCRVFQQQTVLQIAQRLVGAHNEKGQIRLSMRFTAASEEFLQREFCMQYHESDLNFLQRIFAEEGLCWLTQFEDDHFVVVLFFGNTQAGGTGHPGDDDIVFDMRVSETQKPFALIDFSYQRALAPGPQKVAFHDFTAPVIEAQHSVAGNESTLISTSDVLSHVAFGGYDDKNGTFGAHDATKRAQMAHAQRRVASFFGTGGASGAVGLRPASIMQIVGHTDPFLNGRYLVVEVAHVGDDGLTDVQDHQPGPCTYRNDFRCLPLNVRFVPDAVAAPKPSLVLARVGATDEASAVEHWLVDDVVVDKAGRVPISFVWGADALGETQPHCWLRPNNVWAGNAFGLTLWPRIGMEVWVGFINGHPDAPVIVGSAYSAANPPAKVPLISRTRSALRTRTVPASAGFNELSFEDALGRERVSIRSQKTLKIRALFEQESKIGSKFALLGQVMARMGGLYRRFRQHCQKSHQYLQLGADIAQMQDPDNVMNLLHPDATDDALEHIERDIMAWDHKDQPKLLFGMQALRSLSGLKDYVIQKFIDRREVFGAQRIRVHGTAEGPMAVARETIIGAADKLVVKGLQDTWVAQKNEHVQADCHINVDSDLCQTIGKNVTRTVGGSMSTKVAESHDLQVGRDSSTSIAGAAKLCVKQGLALTTGDEAHIKGKTLVLDAEERLVLKQGDALLILEKDCVYIKGSTVRIDATTIDLRAKKMVQAKAPKIALD